MKTTKQFTLLLLYTLLSVAAAFAQSTQNPISQDVTIIIQQEQVRFTSQKAVQMMQLQIFNQAGEKVYDSGPMTVAEINWPLQNINGEALKSGLYAYTLSIQESGAADARVRRGHFIVDRAQDRDAKTDKLWVTSQNESGIGTELTVARNESGTVAGTSTTSDRASERTGSTARDTTQREVAGRGEKTDSTKTPKSTTEGAYDIGSRLEAVYPYTQMRFGASTADNGGYLISTLPSQAIIAGGGSWNGTNWIAKDRAASLTAHQNGVIQFFTNGNLGVGSPFGPVERMRIDVNGNVGIGTHTPSYTLDVGGTLRAVRGISNDIVVETTGGTNAWAKMWMITPSQRWNIGTSQAYKGNQFFLHDATSDQVRMTVQPDGGAIAFPLGSVGIGTTTPQAKLHVAGTVTNERAIFAGGNIAQDLASNGLVKAMISVDKNGAIKSCYNGIANSSSGGCGFEITKPLEGVFRINYGFPVANRFVSVTCAYAQNGYYTSSFKNAGANYRFFDSTSIEVFTFSADDSEDTRDNGFTIILY